MSPISPLGSICIMPCFTPLTVSDLFAVLAQLRKVTRAAQGC